LHFDLKCDIASDGLEAVNLVKNINCCNYKVIFMDCMMPVMDGFEATKHIKEYLKTKNKDILIVGLSAMSL
jgi:CheY-like chemotaxis protein